MDVRTMAVYDGWVRWMFRCAMVCEETEDVPEDGSDGPLGTEIHGIACDGELDAKWTCTKDVYQGRVPWTATDRPTGGRVQWA